jgi:hypothetical protein
LERFALNIISYLMIFFRFVTGLDYSQTLIQIKNEILDNFIFYENMVSFENMADLYRLHLYENGALMVESLIRDQAWLEKLIKKGVFSGVHARVGEVDYTVGSFSTWQNYLTNGYYIDKEGSLHYVYSDDDGRVFLDALIGTGFAENYFNALRRKPSGVFFYDRVNDTYSTVYGETDPFLNRLVWDSPGVIGSLKILGLRKAFFIKPMNLTGSEIYLIASYPFVVGIKVLVLLGLLVNFILVILLIKSVGKYIAVCSKEGRLKEAVVGPVGADTSVIREIDLEVSYAAINKKKSRFEMQESIEKLENDGIYIKRK